MTASIASQKALAQVVVVLTLGFVISECQSTAITFPQLLSANAREGQILQREQQLQQREQMLKNREDLLAQREHELSVRETQLHTHIRKQQAALQADGAKVPTRVGSDGAPPPPTPANDDLNEFFNGLSTFSLDMLQKLAKTETNVAFSPLTTWVLLALLGEGAKGRTLSELQQTLALPTDKNITYRGFETIRASLPQMMQGNSLLNIGSATFTSPSVQLNSDFKRIAEVCYNTTLKSLDFRDRSAAAKVINKWVYDLTDGNIPSILSSEDLYDSKMVLTSALYFSGSWKDAFNESLTRREPFMDDFGQRVAEVDMMYQVGRFRLSFIDGLNAIALELPYSSERNSMLLLLPRRGSTLSELLSNMANFTTPMVPTIMKKLADDELADVDDEDIHVYLPRFELNNKLRLLNLLKKMGIKALFEGGRRELIGLSDYQDLYVSNFVHKAAIKVNERGTTAAAASGAVLHNYSLPSTFKANKPFLFMIIQKSTNAILFAGKVGNPAPQSQTR